MTRTRRRPRSGLTPARKVAQTSTGRRNQSGNQFPAHQKNQPGRPRRRRTKETSSETIFLSLPRTRRTRRRRRKLSRMTTMTRWRGTMTRAGRARRRGDSTRILTMKPRRPIRFVVSHRIWLTFGCFRPLVLPARAQYLTCRRLGLTWRCLRCSVFSVLCCTVMYCTLYFTQCTVLFYSVL